MAEINIVEQTAYNPELTENYDELLASLHLVERYEHSHEEIQSVCEAENSSFYLGMVGNIAVAMATLIHPVVSMGHRTAIIEDVAVMRGNRGNGYGLTILNFVEEKALLLSATRMELHSHDARIEAHGLYRKIGFEIVGTNLFRKELLSN